MTCDTMLVDIFCLNLRNVETITDGHIRIFGDSKRWFLQKSSRLSTPNLASTLCTTLPGPGIEFKKIFNNLCTFQSQNQMTCDTMLVDIFCLNLRNVETITDGHIRIFGDSKRWFLQKSSRLSTPNLASTLCTTLHGPGIEFMSCVTSLLYFCLFW